MRAPRTMDVAIRREQISDGASSGGGPVLLVTLGVPFDPEAVTVAVDSAVESGQPLVIANVVDLEPLACAQVLGYNHLEPPETSASLARPAEIATMFGVEVERIRIKSFRPIAALVEFTHERRASLLVLGPERTAVSRRHYRRAVRAIRERVSCLVWVGG